VCAACGAETVLGEDGTTGHHRGAEGCRGVASAARKSFPPARRRGAGLTGAIMSLIRTLAMLAAFAAALPATAQTSGDPIWPAAPVAMVVPFAAGGPIGHHRAHPGRRGWAELLGQQVGDRGSGRRPAA